MDFSDDQLNSALNGIGALTGEDQSDMSSLSSASKQDHVITEINYLLKSTVGQPQGTMDNFDPKAQEPSPRDQAGANLKSAIRDKSKTPNDMRGIGMAHLMYMQQAGIELPAGIDFAESDQDLSASEITALEGIADFYENNDPIALKSAFAQAAENKAAQELAVEQTQERRTDIAFVQKGLQQLGYLDEDFVVDGQPSQDLRVAMDQYVMDTHMGIQADGAAADYAQDKYNNANVITQWQAMYDKGSFDIKDTVMARKLIETGLDTSGFPATLDNGQGGINPAALQALADKGGLRAVPNDYLSDSQRERFEALGGQDTPKGQTYLAKIITQEGKDWYTKGLETLPRTATMDMKIDEPVVPDSMKLEAGVQYSAATLEAVDIYASLPAAVSDGMSEDVATLVQYKQGMIAGQISLGDTTGGNFKVGGLDFDRGQALVLSRQAEDGFNNTLETIYQAGRLDDVKKELLDMQKDATPATPDSDIQFQKPDSQTPIDLKGLVSQFDGARRGMLSDEASHIRPAPVSQTQQFALN